MRPWNKTWQLVLAALLLIPAAGSGAGDANGNTRAAAMPTEVVYFDYFDATGALDGGTARVAPPKIQPSAIATPSSVAPLNVTGPTTNRVDIVFVGDGYTVAELGAYADTVDDLAAVLFGYEPFTTYQNAFNLHRVDVVSNDSGIDHDPVFGIYRDTALDGELWCQGLERRLCIDTAKAEAFAAQAPAVDLIIAVANSTAHAGAGYPRIVTVAGESISAHPIMVHEMGHSAADLGDEYDYADGATYTGPELDEPNVSILDATAMAAADTKWADWLGTNNAAYGGLIGTYEGAYYNQYGAYRPTTDSLMRSTVAPTFNLPSIEALVISFYEFIDVIDGWSPSGSEYNGSEQLSLNLIPGVTPVGVQWLLDGTPIPGATGTTLDLATLAAPAQPYTVSAVAVDNTSFVRDNAARGAVMTDRVDFTVRPGAGWSQSSSLLASSITPFAMQLDWSGAIVGAAFTQYGIFQDGALVATVPTSTQSRQVSGLMVETPYTFKVEGRAGAGPWSTDGPQLTVATTNFVDTTTSAFKDDITRLARAGITRGCNPPANDRYCPLNTVTRGQMAAFLVRALGYTASSGDLFNDDNGTTFEDDINRLGTAGVTRGCNPPINDRYCPDNTVTRGQMAAFLRRALNL
ncbi:MAG: M64 family metallopeptidase [Acidimicrobiia bacterium]|nr:M64 family metallopeptidase [Acidimicrobiia bacterium]